jgi:hypothetical protein
MSGITFMADERGQKTAAVIDLRRHGRVWKDFYDGLIAKSRAGEPRETLESVKHRLRERGQRHG